MTPLVIGLIGMGALVLLIFARVPVAIAMGLVGFCGYAALNGVPKALTILGQVPFDIGTGYALSVVPLFILMGDIAMRAGMSARLYDAARACFAGQRGSLALATLGACAAFGAICGSSLATAATMTKVAIPEMDRVGYDTRLSTGAVAAGGTLGILIPPSIPLVIYSIIAEQSVSRLFAATLIPCFVLTGLYMLVVVALLIFKRTWAPSDPQMSVRQRISAALSVWDVLILFGVTIGGIYAGWFTPNQAAAVGAFGAWLLGIARGRLTLFSTWQALSEAIRTSCMLFMIVICAVVLSYFIVQTDMPSLLVGLVRQWQVSPVVLMILIVMFYVVMGCFLDGFGMILITVPIFLPMVTQSGFDPIWFGVILVIVIELGLIHPPVGMNIFVIQAQAPQIPVYKIYQGIVPFLVAPFVLLGLLIAFPEIALWLPNQLFTPR
ncbi:MAG TPA: TRAP transporter large permease [Alphaproteobacteria bacterium]|nr:TRAP transporter large permease [Alphaproteobacteria bacterium]